MVQPDTYALKDRDLLFKSRDDYAIRFKELPDYEKPRERLLELGPSYLSVAELAAIVWNVGTSKENVLVMAL